MTRARNFLLFVLLAITGVTAFASAKSQRIWQREIDMMGLKEIVPELSMQNNPAMPPGQYTYSITANDLQISASDEAGFCDGTYELLRRISREGWPLEVTLKYLPINGAGST